MSVTIIPVENKRQLKAFIYLPKKIHKNHDNWMPPIYMDEWAFHNPQKNRLLRENNTILALAYQDHELVGRIMGIIHYKYNEANNEKNARFFKMECTNDQEVAHALLNHVASWAKENGMENLVGPYGFSDKDPQGFQFEGFGELPVIEAPNNEPYMLQLVENEGYKADVAWVEYKFNVPDKMPELYEKVYERLMRSGKYQVIEPVNKKEIKKYIIPVFELINDTFKHLYGFAFMSHAEMKYLAKQYMPVLDPRFLKLVALDNEIVGVIVAIPNLTTGIRKAKGRILPFGIFKIKSEMRKTRQIDLMIGGIKEELRGRGIDVLLGRNLLKSAMEGGFKVIDSHLELEDNIKIRAEMERMGGKVVKRFRTYKKTLI